MHVYIKNQIENQTQVLSRCIEVWYEHYSPWNESQITFWHISYSYAEDGTSWRRSGYS